MSVNLNFSVVGEGPAVILLHGLFGLGSNLGALARSLQDGYRVYSIDLPNHGRSDWLSNAGIPAMAECLQDWLSQQGIGQASLVGHSLGGKVAMQMALNHPQRIHKLVVADIAPVAYPAQHNEVFDALDAVTLAQPQSRQQAMDVMSGVLQEEGVIQLLSMSLARDDEGVYQWRLNVEELKASYDLLRAGMVTEQPFTGPVMFIKGADSAYIQKKHRDSIASLFPNADLKVIPDTGHWLHAEQPRLFNGIVRRFLD
jgi:esterase